MQRTIEHPSDSVSVPGKSIKERALHAALFELGGIALIAPLLSWLMGHSLVMMGAMTVMISTLAMIWNMVYNALFDRFRKRQGFDMTFMARALHAVGFEAGLILIVVPLAAWWLSISLWQAFVLDIGLLLMFLPYTMCFNWAWDKVGERIAQRRLARCPTV